MNFLKQVAMIKLVLIVFVMAELTGAEPKPVGLEVGKGVVGVNYNDNATPVQIVPEAESNAEVEVSSSNVEIQEDSPIAEGKLFSAEAEAASAKIDWGAEPLLSSLFNTDGDLNLPLDVTDLRSSDQEKRNAPQVAELHHDGKAANHTTTVAAHPDGKSTNHTTTGVVHHDGKAANHTTTVAATHHSETSLSGHNTTGGQVLHVEAKVAGHNVTGVAVNPAVNGSAGSVKANDGKAVGKNGTGQGVVITKEMIEHQKSLWEQVKATADAHKIPPCPNKQRFFIGTKSAKTGIKQAENIKEDVSVVVEAASRSMHSMSHCMKRMFTELKAAVGLTAHHKSTTTTTTTTPKPKSTTSTSPPIRKPAKKQRPTVPTVQPKA